MDKGTAVSFFYDVVRSVNSVIRDDYNLMVRGIDDYRNFNLISKKNFDGIVIMSQSTGDDAFITAVHERQIPMVVLNREVEMLYATFSLMIEPVCFELRSIWFKRDIERLGL